MAVSVDILGPAPVDPIATQHMVPMRDGVELATDVYLPEGAGPFPAVLVRLPYDKNGRYCWMPFIARHFIARGYAFLPQDVRGKFRSGGDPLAFVNEVPDGYDTIEWITSQPWCNGDVGMWGDSYYGFTQWAAVASGHPALKAIVPRVTIVDIDSLAGRRDAALRRPLPGGVLDRPQHQRVADRLEPAATGRGVRRGLRAARAALRVVRLRAGALARRPAGAHLPRRPPVRRAAHPDAARRRLVRQHHAAAHARLRGADGGTRRRRRSSTCTPARPTTRTTRSRRRRSRSATTTRRTTTRWPRCCPATWARRSTSSTPSCRGAPTRRPCRACAGTCRGEGWRESASWPPPGAHELRLYLDEPAKAAGAPPGGLLAARPGEAGEAAWMHDPEDLVPSTLVDPFSVALRVPGRARGRVAGRT